MTPRIDRTHGPGADDAGVGVRPNEPPEALPVEQPTKLEADAGHCSSKSVSVDVAVGRRASGRACTALRRASWPPGARAAQASGSRSSSTTARAVSCGEAIAVTSRPRPARISVADLPSMSSRQQPTSVATTGTPAANASRTTSGCASLIDVSTRQPEPAAETVLRPAIAEEAHGAVEAQAADQRPALLRVVRVFVVGADDPRLGVGQHR